MDLAILPFGVTQEEPSPKLIRSFCFPMILSKKQETLLHHVLDLGHEIRERVVAQRIQNRADCRAKVSAGLVPEYLKLTEQRRAIAAWLKSDAKFKLIHSQVAQNQCERIDMADKHWLKSLKMKDKRAKPARHRDRKCFRSITYPQYGNGVRLSAGKVWFSKIGSFRVRDYQKVPGTKKTVSIVWKQGKFWAVFTALQAPSEWFEPASEWQDKPSVGGDFGLKSLLTLSDGRVFDPPRRLKLAFQTLRTIQQSVSRKFEARKVLWAAYQAKAKEKGSGLPVIELRDFSRSNRLRADIRRLAKAHTKVERCRDNDHRKVASILQANYGKVALEDHGTLFMLRNRRLAKSAADRGLSKLKLRIKSTLAPERVLLVSSTDANGGGNSQTCTCGASVPKTLKDRIHTCTSCGRVGDRDVVAADRVHLRTFGRVTQVRGQRICPASNDARKRGERKSGAIKRWSGESAPAGFQVFDEAHTFQAILALENTSDGQPTKADKNSLALELKELVP